MGVSTEPMPQMSGARNWACPEASSHVPELHVAGQAPSRARLHQGHGLPQGTTGVPLGCHENHSGLGKSGGQSIPQYSQPASMAATTGAKPPPASLAGFSTIGTEDSLGLLPLEKVRYAQNCLGGSAAAFSLKRHEPSPPPVITVPAAKHGGSCALSPDSSCNSDWIQHVPISAASPGAGAPPPPRGVGRSGGLVGVPVVAVHREYRPHLIPSAADIEEGGLDPGLLDLERRLEMVTLGPENAALSRAKDPAEEWELKALEDKLELITAQRSVSAIKCEMFLDYLEQQQRKLTQAQPLVQVEVPPPAAPPLSRRQRHTTGEPAVGTRSQVESSSDSGSDSTVHRGVSGARSGPLNPALQSDLGYYRMRTKGKSARGPRTPSSRRKSSSSLSPLHAAHVTGIGWEGSAHLGYTTCSQKEPRGPRQGRKSASGASPMHPMHSPLQGPHQDMFRGQVGLDASSLCSPAASAEFQKSQGIWGPEASGERAMGALPDGWSKPVHGAVRYGPTGSPARVFGASPLRSFCGDAISLDQHCPAKVVGAGDAGSDTAGTGSLGDVNGWHSGYPSRAPVVGANARGSQGFEDASPQKMSTVSYFEGKFHASWDKQRAVMREDGGLDGLQAKAGRSGNSGQFGTGNHFERQQKSLPEDTSTHHYYHTQARYDFGPGQHVPQLLVQ